MIHQLRFSVLHNFLDTLQILNTLAPVHLPRPLTLRRRLASSELRV
jgi:hypothetical protein